MYPLALGRALSKARAARGWDTAALSAYARASHLAAQGAGGLLFPLVKLHGCRLRLVAAAARLLGLCPGGRGGSPGARPGAPGAAGASEAARLLRAAARHCFRAEAHAALARLPAGPCTAGAGPAPRRRRHGAGAGSGSGRSDGGSSGSDGGGGGRLDPGYLAPAVDLLAADCLAALRFCQDRYSQPGQLHSAGYCLARGLALLGR
jgi:hypothetical protein